jgi:hypothetical protein
VLDRTVTWIGGERQGSLMTRTAPQYAGTLEQTNHQSGYQANHQEFQ